MFDLKDRFNIVVHTVTRDDEEREDVYRFFGRLNIITDIMDDYKGLDLGYALACHNNKIRYKTLRSGCERDNIDLNKVIPLVLRNVNLVKNLDRDHHSPIQRYKLFSPEVLEDENTSESYKLARLHGANHTVATLISLNHGKVHSIQWLNKHLTDDILSTAMLLDDSVSVWTTVILAILCTPDELGRIYKNYITELNKGSCLMVPGKSPILFTDYALKVADKIRAKFGKLYGLELLVDILKVQNKDDKEIYLDSFDFKIYNHLKKLGMNEYAYLAASGFGKEGRNLILGINDVDKLHRILSVLKLKRMAKNEELRHFIIDNFNKYSSISLGWISYEWNKKFVIGMSNEEIKKLSRTHTYRKAIKEFNKEYPILENANFKCLLKDNPIQCEDISVRLLDANDPLQIVIGEITHCCQTIGGAGEYCVVEGLINPYSGFIVFERGHKVLAQAWVWLTADKKTLVLDNIEMANSRDISCVKDALLEWVKKSPYQNIQMGLGYNELRSIGKESMSVRNASFKNKEVWTNFLTQKMDPEYFVESVYTDAWNRTWLKKKGVDWTCMLTEKEVKDVLSIPKPERDPFLFLKPRQGEEKIIPSIELRCTVERAKFVASEAELTRIAKYATSTTPLMLDILSLMHYTRTLLSNGTGSEYSWLERYKDKVYVLLVHMVYKDIYYQYYRRIIDGRKPSKSHIEIMGDAIIDSMGELFKSTIHSISKVEDSVIPELIEYFDQVDMSQHRRFNKIFDFGKRFIYSKLTPLKIKLFELLDIIRYYPEKIIPGNSFCNLLESLNIYY